MIGLSDVCDQVNLQTGIPAESINETCTAGAGTLLLEFGLLSRLLGDPVYEGFARRSIKQLWSLRSNVTGLFGMCELVTLDEKVMFLPWFVTSRIACRATAGVVLVIGHFFALMKVKFSLSLPDYNSVSELSLVPHHLELIFRTWPNIWLL